MSQSINHGFRATLPYQAGAFLACFFILLLGLLLGHELEKALPQVISVMTYVGCAYMLYLAFMVARSKPQGMGAPAKQAHFWLGFGLQFVNPKYYLYVLTLVAGLVPLVPSLTGMVLAACFFSFLSVGGIFTWALCGALLQELLRRHYRLANGLMALALVYCSLSLFL